MPGGRLDADLQHGADEDQRRDAPIAQCGLQRRADERGHAELVEHRLPCDGSELVDDRGVRCVRRKRAGHVLRPVLALPRHRRAQGADPEVGRGQGDVADVEHGDTRRAGGVDDLADPVDERLPVLDVRQDADLRMR